MTEITYYTDGREFSIESRGHSGYAESGKDIVCAGISTLLQTLIFYTNTDNYDIGDGYLWVHGSGSRDLIAYEMAITGLNLIEGSYPNNVKLTEGCTIQRHSKLK